MQIPDVNVLINAVVPTGGWHAPARDWLAAGIAGDFSIGFTWHALTGFVRITSNAKLFARPLTPTAAMGIVDGWLGAPSAVVLQPTARHANILGSLLQGINDRHSLVMDAHLAAIAVSHNATLVTFDRDFFDFPGLKVDLLR